MSKAERIICSEVLPVQAIECSGYGTTLVVVSDTVSTETLGGHAQRVNSATFITEAQVSSNTRFRVTVEEVVEDA